MSKLNSLERKIESLISQKKQPNPKINYEQSLTDRSQKY